MAGEVLGSPEEGTLLGLVATASGGFEPFRPPLPLEPQERAVEGSGPELDRLRSPVPVVLLAQIPILQKPELLQGPEDPPVQVRLLWPPLGAFRRGATLP